MTENGFVPLSPRRLIPIRESATEAMVPAAADGDEDHIPVEQLPEPATEAIKATETREAVERRDALGSQQVDDDELKSIPDADLTRVLGGSDQTRIRAAAIDLAAAACARALRYAIERNPRLLARFVDDALRAAGSPRTAVVRIAPSAAFAGAESDAYDFVADPAFSPGDVLVECDAGTLGATVEERAERLVRSVAS